MYEPISAVRLRAFADIRRTAARRAAHYALAVPFAGALWLLGAVATPAAVTATAAGAAAALWCLVRSRAAAASRLELVDDLILRGWRNVAPEDVDARARELVSARQRRLLARALRNQLEYARAGIGFAFGGHLAGVDLGLLQRNVDAIVARLRDMSRPVEPRGMVVLSRLMSEGGSALVRGRMGGLEPALRDAGVLLERPPS